MVRELLTGTLRSSSVIWPQRAADWDIKVFFQGPLCGPASDERVKGISTNQGGLEDAGIEPWGSWRHCEEPWGSRRHHKEPWGSQRSWRRLRWSWRSRRQSREPQMCRRRSRRFWRSRRRSRGSRRCWGWPRHCSRPCLSQGATRTFYEKGFFEDNDKCWHEELTSKSLACTGWLGRAQTHRRLGWGRGVSGERFWQWHLFWVSASLWRELEEHEVLQELKVLFLDWARWTQTWSMELTLWNGYFCYYSCFTHNIDSHASLDLTRHCRHSLVADTFKRDLDMRLFR